MALRRRKKSKKLFSLLYAILGVVAFAILLFIANVIYESGYLHGYKEGFAAAKEESKPEKKIKKTKQKSSSLKTNLSEIEDYRRNSQTPLSQEERLKKKAFSQPRNILTRNVSKLVIIIDDVAYGYQVKRLLSLHMPITLSFFPPSKRHPNTAKYARKTPHVMVHLPLEAIHYTRQESNTLKTTSSLQEIERVVRKVRRLFPHVRYINNHTGSKFTSDLEAMRRLISVFDRYGFVFVDSRTTAATKVPQVMQEFGHPYLHRDIFLDNEQNITYIQNQLKKAIRIAQKRGYAIAIGHPHPKTIEALRRSKKLLKKVRLVYIDQL